MTGTWFGEGQEAANVYSPFVKWSVKSQLSRTKITIHLTTHWFISIICWCWRTKRKTRKTPAYFSSAPLKSESSTVPVTFGKIAIIRTIDQCLRFFLVSNIQKVFWEVKLAKLYLKKCLLEKWTCCSTYWCAQWHTKLAHWTPPFWKFTKNNPTKNVYEQAFRKTIGCGSKDLSFFEILC